MTAKSRRRALVVRWLAALPGAGLVAAGPLAAQSISPSAAPAEWVAYAERATTRINGWLQAEDEPAQRLRAYLDQLRPAPDQPGAPLDLKVWVDPDGTVSRVDFAPFAHPEPNADLRALVVGRRLAGPPPRNMLLPLRLAVQVEPPEPHGPAPKTSPAREGGNPASGEAIPIRASGNPAFAPAKGSGTSATVTGRVERQAEGSLSIAAQTPSSPHLRVAGLRR